MTASPSMSPQQAKLTDSQVSGFALYKNFVVGRASLAFFAYYELVTLLFSGLPGLLGFAARSLSYPCLFKRCGKRPAFGRGVVLRGPQSISLGAKNLVDDYAVLDVRGEGAEIVSGDFVSIGRFSTIAAKGGQILLGNAVNVGSYCRIATQSKVEIGESVLVAAYCYIGSGNHQVGDDSTPLIEREMEIKGGVKIGAHAWIGAHSTILDGVTIGERAIIGAHSLVKESIPADCVAVGSPAKVIKQLR
ncbi:MAG: acyltransferase [Deltaproteobacteria bacterium]|nr:acyltransferase [Deltaproteobacteria bacterium]